MHDPIGSSTGDSDQRSPVSPLSRHRTVTQSVTLRRTHTRARAVTCPRQTEEGGGGDDFGGFEDEAPAKGPTGAKKKMASVQPKRDAAAVSAVVERQHTEADLRSVCKTAECLALMQPCELSVMSHLPPVVRYT